MKVKTHVKLAELSLIKNLNIVPVGFNKFMFNFGLIMVDQSWHIKTHPHYAQKSLEYIHGKIEELLSVKKFNGYYSMQLGIVIHYLCDFCCNSHITGSIGNITYHVKYEYELQKYLLKNYDNFKEQIKNKSSNINFNLNNIAAIKECIKNTLNNYRCGEASYSWDIKHCIEICSMVCSTVFSANFNFAKNINMVKKQLQPTI